MEWTKARVILAGLPEFYRFADQVDDIDTILYFVDNAHQPRVLTAVNAGISIDINPQNLYRNFFVGSNVLVSNPLKQKNKKLLPASNETR
jgi:hypothetical protein